MRVLGLFFYELRKPSQARSLLGLSSKKVYRRKIFRSFLSAVLVPLGALEVAQLSLTATGFKRPAWAPELHFESILAPFWSPAGSILGDFFDVIFRVRFVSPFSH